MWRLTFAAVLVVAVAVAVAEGAPKTGDDLASAVLSDCAEMGCVKRHVLGYLDGLLNIDSGNPRKLKNIDAAIFKRAAKVLKTHEFRVRMPEALFDGAEIVYNPRRGLDVESTGAESRGMMLKKKLLLPILLLLKLKMKALMPIFVGLIGIKALKALILSKLAILIVIGFVAYQFLGKAGMPMMPMSMGPAEPPAPLYGPPAGPSSPPPSSYDPGWEPNQGGPYSRVWTPTSNDNGNGNGNGAQNMAYSAYYPGPSYAGPSSSTIRP